jgi:uncharacterized membrane protein
LRYLLAIGGLLIGAIVIVALWLFLPRSDAPPPAAAVVATAQAQAPATNQADSGGEGSFRVCNQTRNAISVAFGYRADRGWRSEGWWVIDPNGCETIYTGDLSARSYYYLYAADDIGGGSWEGNVFMCTRDENFTIFDVDDCLARGYERTGFFEIDTKRSSDWTVQLTESQVPGAEPADGTDADAPMEGDFGEDVGEPAEGEPAEGADQ